MKEKIKKIGLTLFYLFVWAIFLYPSLGLFIVLLEIFIDLPDVDLEDIKRWDIFLIFLLSPFLSGYLLRNHFKFLFSTARGIWKKSILSKVIIIAIPIVIVGGIWWYQHQQDIVICKKRCVYNKHERVWHYVERIPPTEFQRIFPKQEQCIDYCLTVK